MTYFARRFERYGALMFCAVASACGLEPDVLGRVDAEVDIDFVQTPADAAVWIDASDPRRDGGLSDGYITPVPEAGIACATDRVDLLLVIDNSGSMAEEQKKLNAVLPQLVTALTTGFLTPKPIGSKPDFPPVQSLHVGVVTSDMGINGITGQQSCGDVSFDPTAPDPANPAPSVRSNPPINAARYDKPRGDDAVLSTSVAVALAGISARPADTTFSTPVTTVVAPDPECSKVAYFQPGQRFVDYTADFSNLILLEKQVGCIAKLGKNGCGFEQQLDAMLKAVTPSTSSVTFAAGSKGHGDGQNRGFLRPDAILAVLHLSDEDDCSILDTPLSRELFNSNSQTLTEDINIRCGLAKYQGMLHDVSSRYVANLKALKGYAASDRIVFSAIVGVPPQANNKVYTGTAELNGLLFNPNMQFVPRQIPNTTLFEATPACTNGSGAGSAAPARRFVELARELGDNGQVSSICEDEYGTALQAFAARIGKQLNQDACLTN